MRRKFWEPSSAYSWFLSILPHQQREMTESVVTCTMQYSISLYLLFLSLLLKESAITHEISSAYYNCHLWAKYFDEFGLISLFVRICVYLYYPTFSLYCLSKSGKKSAMKSISPSNFAFICVSVHKKTLILTNFIRFYKMIHLLLIFCWCFEKIHHIQKRGIS